jgi:PAS domain S-box-containing protein
MHGDPPVPRTHTLRTQLVGLAVAALVPVLALAAALIVHTTRQERAAVGRGLIDGARAISNAVDRELGATVTTLQALAATRWREPGDVEAFRDEARRVLRSHAAFGWVNIRLAAPDGTQLVSVADAAAPSPDPDPPTLREAIRLGRPLISNVQPSPTTEGHVWSARLPIARDGAVRYVVTASVAARAMAAALASEQGTSDRIAVLYDRHDTIVHRTVSAERLVGSPVTPALAAASRATRSGILDDVNREGTPVRTAFHRSAFSGWTVGVGVPHADLFAPSRASLLTLSAATAGALVISGLAVVLLERRIRRPIRRLAAAASTFADAESAAAVAGVAANPGTREVGSLAASFAEAARAVHEQRAALERQLAEIEAIYRTAPVGLCVLDTEGRYLRINERLAQMNGAPAAAHLGRTVHEMTPALAAATEPFRRRVIERGEPVQDVEIRGTTATQAGAERVWIQSWFPIRDSDGRVTAVNVVVEDATERKRAEEARLRALDAERAARTQAETANRAKDEFLAVLSHELRTPLSAVYGWARMLQAGQIRGDQSARALDAIVRNASVQVQLIDDLLDVSRIISGKMQLDTGPVDLRAVVEAALDAVRPAAAAKEIELRSAVDPGVGPIRGDAGRLQQVVWNLLSNAVKFTPNRGRVEVELRQADGAVEVVVADSGQGIPADVLPFVFDRFRQGDSSSTRTHGGLGLGLALAKHLVELHGGDIAARSSGAGQGAIFTVRLPAGSGAPAGGGEGADVLAAAPPAPARGERLDGLRVLVVDDAPEALDLAAAILTGAGADVRRALSAPEAFQVFEHWRPDVLVSDIEMPGEDGYSLIRRIRAREGAKGGSIPAVALSAYGRPHDRMQSLTAGYTVHVAKPVDPVQLTAIIASVAPR